ncbi:hypothetical protein H2204_008671 [Knufia peltigerae]|uniref:Uncharacterized protein n=1 Tax=Knufia peltigerae TaxID=1002370 RepID=A0AA39CWP4_9EURO|nr:hypothetical protein H2204_008671 [Knufia peltigerae]
MEALKSAFGGGGGDSNNEGSDINDVQVSPAGQDDDMPSREEMLKTIESLQKAQKAQSAANDIKSKAMAMTNSKKREEMLREAFDKEMEANGHSKMARRMQSGTWQGLGFGGGIGAASGLGLGTGLGTVLGAILAVPSTGLGMLVGSGVGAVHGPWVKLGGGKEEPFEDADPEKVVDAIEEERKVAVQQQQQGQGREGQQKTTDGRRKPPKLEIRSKKKKEDSNESQDGVNDTKKEKNGGVSTGNVQMDTAEESKPRRKPPKLEIRSGKRGSNTAKA